MTPIVVDDPGIRVVSFRDYTPPARYQPITTPWTAVRVEEAPAPAGPFTAIDTITLDPVDRHPDRPGRRSLSTPYATLTEGWYRLVWVDDSGDEAVTDAVLDAPGLTSPTWAPSVQDVANLCPAYTRAPVDGDGEQAGAEQKTFTDDTDPTATEVQGLIAAAVDEVVSRVGVSIQRLEQFGTLARVAATWHAATSVEGEKIPEGATETTSAYAWKSTSYVACLNELIAQARGSAVRLSRVGAPSWRWREPEWDHQYRG